MKTPRLVIAGTHSGVGKSTVALGIMAALRHQGVVVQPFKVGPDYIDGSYHSAITGRTSRNLDTWMLGQDNVRRVFLQGAKDADISIIEGVMGLYDGKGVLSSQGSTAATSTLLECPVLLVIDISGMARSAAAVVKGFQTFDTTVNIAGVIANRAGGEGHFRLIQQVVQQECGIPVIGYLPEDADISIPERHLGLIPAIEQRMPASVMDKIGKLVASTIDIDALSALAQAAPDLSPTRNLFGSLREGEGEAASPTWPQTASPTWPQTASPKVRIAVARDEAFNFYYAENLELLETFGATLEYFSPLRGEELPVDVDGLYIGGGFPEEFAETLSSRKTVLEDFKRQIELGLPTYAECGGYMFLATELVDLNGEAHGMVGVIPARVVMKPRLVGFGYREVAGSPGNWLLPTKETARGHEFHYSAMTYFGEQSYAYFKGDNAPVTVQHEGYLRKNLIAGYTHLHFLSNPVMAQRFVKRCALYREQQLQR